MQYPADIVSALNGHSKTVGPWPCERCNPLALRENGLTQYAKCNSDVNLIYCVRCGYQRIIDKKRRIVIENDGRRWNIDSFSRPMYPIK